ncbi:GNAT domain [Trinorchestia longiramus]|nr:GNAT domain [Trinorchestia longiramus]
MDDQSLREALLPSNEENDDDSTVSSKPGLCLLRPFKQQDEIAVKKIINDATMEPMGEYFMKALFSEIFLQMAFLSIAVGFIGFSIPLTLCVTLIPVAVAVVYIAIYAAHAIKVMELHGDLSNISQVYQQDDDTGFWVAEVYDFMEGSELSAHFNITKKVMYDFVTQEELDRREINLAEYKHRSVVGCIALTHSLNSDNVRKAWLRRMAVKMEYRRRNIGSNLLELAIDFARRHQYKGIELLTTECHYQAREMYHKSGFTATMNTRYFFNVPQPTYLFTMSLKSSEESKKLE